jgi:hypothetical protein
VSSGRDVQAVGLPERGAVRDIHAVDLTTGDVLAATELDVTANEIAIATGIAH